MPAREQRPPGHAADGHVARFRNPEIGRHSPERRRPERDLLNRRGRPLAAREVRGALEGQPHAVVAGVKEVRRHDDVVALLGAGDVERPHRLLVDEDRHLLRGRQRPHGERQRARAGRGAPCPVTVGVDGKKRHRRDAVDERRRLPFVLFAEQPGGLPATVDVLEKVERSRVDDQAAVAVRDRVHPIGDEVEGGPGAGAVGCRCAAARCGRRRGCGHRRGSGVERPCRLQAGDRSLRSGRRPSARSARRGAVRQSQNQSPNFERAPCKASIAEPHKRQGISPHRELSPGEGARRSAAATGRAELRGDLGGRLAEIDLLGPGRVAGHRRADRDLLVAGGRQPARRRTERLAVDRDRRPGR